MNGIPESGSLKLILLGTGYAHAVSCYNTCFVLADGDRLFLTDGGGGNGIFLQLEQAGLRWQDIHHIFVTHKHIDHILGVLWMIRRITLAMYTGNYQGEAWIYGHAEVISILREMSEKLLVKKTLPYLDRELHLVPVSDGQELEIIGHRVQFFDIRSTKDTQYGFTFAYGDGKKLTCCGDEPCSTYGESFARGSDWLLHEAFCLSSQADVFRPHEKHHSTVVDVCQLAERLQVKNLVLYHTEDSDIRSRRERYTAEGQPYFHGRLCVPEDLEVIQLDT